MPGILYLIPNALGPIDPHEFKSLDCIIPDEVQRITATIDYFIAENAKATRAFLKYISTKNQLIKPLQELQISELNVNTNSAKLPELLAPILAGNDGGIISEAGVPTVADPGANLVRLAHEHGIIVKPLVGPSSLLLALMASGLNGQRFAFNGYLPVNPAQRSKSIKALEERSRREKETQLFIETPYRNSAMLDALVENCQSSTLISVATDLSLQTESIKTYSASHWKKNLAINVKNLEFNKKPTVFLFLA